MANTRSMTRKLKKFSTSGNDNSASWSNLNHELLFLIMMQVGVFDFIAFSGVCKSWRSVAVSNWNKFMVSKQPMYLSISNRLIEKDCFLVDYKRRKLKTAIPHSDFRKCIGITCGYLIFFGSKNSSFWLWNPITRRELHFPGCPLRKSTIPENIRGILVFSHSMSGWVFVVSSYTKICFSLAGKQAGWRYISTNLPICDLHFFKGKIYMINDWFLFELKLDPEPTFTVQKMKNFLRPTFRAWGFVSSGDKLYVSDKSGDVLVEIDFDEMKWVNSERTIGEYAVFVSEFNCNAAIKPDTWAHPWTRYERINCFQNKITGSSCLTRKMWYFPHDCLIDNDSDTEHGALLNILEE